MKTQYLLRFDDICPTMNWKVWREIEKILIEYNVKPLLAVIPDCQDKNLFLEAPEIKFWDCVRGWQMLGWTIAMHGHQHVYSNKEPGLLRIQYLSEFAGVPPQEQEKKISESMQIFNREGLKPHFFVAPSHSFDRHTLEALGKNHIDTISDGFGYRPFCDADNGLLFIPQQMLCFRKMPFGIWTVCLHHNHWKAVDLQQFRENIKKFSKQLTDFNEVRTKYAGRKATTLDKVVSGALEIVFRIKRTSGLK